MSTHEQLHFDFNRSSTEGIEAAAPENDLLIAISAEELIKSIRSGQGSDVNELIEHVIHGRQAA